MTFLRFCNDESQGKQEIVLATQADCVRQKWTGEEVVEVNDVLVIVETMKMEIAITAQINGKISQIICSEGNPVAPGQALLIIEEMAWI